MIAENTNARGLGQSVDWKLIGCYLLLVFIGWINIYASIHSSEPSSIFDWSVRSGKQFVWMLTAFALAAMTLFLIPTRIWEGLAIPMYVFVCFLLVAVIFVSKDVNGSHSWFELGPVKFQPAEISKITTSLLLANIMSRQSFRLSKLKDFITVALVIAIPMLIIIAESETGSALVYAGFIFVLYREGLSGWFLFIIGMAILLFITTLTLSPYASILILVSILSICNVFRIRRFWKPLLIGTAFVTFMSILPWLWGMLTDAVQAAVWKVQNTVTVEIPGEEKRVFLEFLLKIKPIYILLASCGGILVYFAYKAFKERNLFKQLSVASFVAGVVLIFSADIIFNNVLQDHQRNRIEVLLGMKEDPAGVGYNVNQSMIAIGSGGMFGKGFLRGTQTTYGFVPEQSTDFIFCTVGEEWGFAGCAIVIFLYVFLIARIIIDAERCREHFTRIYGFCVASCVFMHLVIIIGMTIGLVPVIGIPLPLLSYGGSSLWSFTMLIFIFIALYRQEKKYF